MCLPKIVVKQTFFVSFYNSCANRIRLVLFVFGCTRTTRHISSRSISFFLPLSFILFPFFSAAKAYIQPYNSYRYKMCTNNASVSNGWHASDFPQQIIYHWQSELHLIAVWYFGIGRNWKMEQNIDDDDNGGNGRWATRRERTIAEWHTQRERERESHI